MATLLYCFGIVFTYTGSVPIGWYHTVHPARPIHAGDYIIFCLKESIAKEGLKRGYLNHGYCKSGSEALIKQVVAVPGDTVELTAQHMTVAMPHRLKTITLWAPSHVVDTQRQHVHRFLHDGIYVAKGYWVYGVGSPHYSWDSRYYGGIPLANIKHRVSPLLIF